MPPSEGFAVLRTTRNSDDALPSELASVLSQSTQPEFTEHDMYAARRILALNPGWLIPAANGEVCLARLVYPLSPPDAASVSSPIPANTCVPEASAQAGRLVETQSLSTTVSAPGRDRVVGVAPDGVTTVNILQRNGRHVAVPVIRNGYEAIASDPVAVRLAVSLDRRQVIDVIPLRTFSARNPSPLAK